MDGRTQLESHFEGRVDTQLLTEAVQLERRTNRAYRIVFVGGRHAEQCHQGVSLKLIHDAAVPAARYPRHPDGSGPPNRSFHRNPATP